MLKVGIIDKTTAKTKTVSLRITEHLNHYLDTRVLEIRACAQSKRGIDKSWLMLRLMELGQEWLSSYHLNQMTDFEESIRKELNKREKKRVKSDIDEGIIQGLHIALESFMEYEKYVCQIGEESEEVEEKVPELPEI